MKLHQLLADGLIQLGVTHLFGLIGDANLFIVNSYTETCYGNYLGCNHEATAVLAAIGYAQVTGKTGVATITHGPGLTNATTALVEAVKGGIPLVVLCGDTAQGDLQHLQKINQREIVAATGADFVELRSSETAIIDLNRAFRLAKHHRQPVVLNVRADLQWAEAELQQIEFEAPDVTLAAAGGALLEEAVGMLASARRPLILAGRGAIDHASRAALISLAKRIEAPLAATLKAQGLFEGEEFNIGVFGTLSHSAAIETIMQSDCIIAFGASLNKYTTDKGALTKGKRIVQILPDTIENMRMAPPSIRLIGNIAGTARAIINLLDMADIPGSDAIGADLASRLAAETNAFETVLPSIETANGTVDLVPALRKLHQALPRNRVLVTDLGRFVHYVWRNIPVNRPHNLVFTSHFGAIGCGIGQAIGAASAIQDRPIVLVAGDGGFMLSGLGELSVVVRENAQMIIIICNDGSYGAEHIQFTDRNISPELSMITPPDFAAVAESIGLKALTVRHEADLRTACKAISDQNGPLLIELRLDPFALEM